MMNYYLCLLQFVTLTLQHNFLPVNLLVVLLQGMVYLTAFVMNRQNHRLDEIL